MKSLSIVFPHQLFKESPLIKKGEKVVLIEDHLYFSQFKFHKQKLLLHRASMKFYADYLRDKSMDVEYIEFHQFKSLSEMLNEITSEIGKIRMIELSDYLLNKRVKKYCKDHDIVVEEMVNPGFLNTPEELESYMNDNEKYFMHSFYIHQRKRLGILVKNNKPIGDKWSFDAENRKKIPKDLKIPEYPEFKKNKYIQEAEEYIDKHFSDNPGKTDRIFYPVTFEDARVALNDFLEKRMELFGDYEDAIKQGENFQYHSVLSPLLNVGLLTPDEVLDTTIDNHNKKGYPMNSLEGFIRQIIGWREFMRMIYLRDGSKIRNQNYFGHRNPLPASFWDGSTGIDPVDDTIKKILDTGYAHHIERLMVMGNIMFLLNIDPDEIYEWFMALFIDAYDWVMVPNVYSMSQYSDGGLTTTKPYFSGSNYILKMSDYSKGEWSPAWDGLYWQFIHEQYSLLKDNVRMKMMLALYNKMDENKMGSHLKEANGFREKLGLLD